jgi:hypothetical protein
MAERLGGHLGSFLAELPLSSTFFCVANMKGRRDVWAVDSVTGRCPRVRVYESVFRRIFDDAPVGFH